MSDMSVPNQGLLPQLADTARQKCDVTQVAESIRDSRMTPETIRHQLRRNLAAISPEEFECISRSSRETSTHYAWCLLPSKGDHCSIWLNEYKEADDQLPGYANVVHNHRYDFLTLVLCGGYVQEFFEPKFDQNDGLRDARSTGEELLKVGDSRIMRNATFHRLRKIASGTVTLLFKSVARRSASQSIDLDTGRVRTHVPIEQRKAHLIDRLVSTVQEKDSNLC